MIALRNTHFTAYVINRDPLLGNPVTFLEFAVFLPTLLPLTLPFDVMDTWFEDANLGIASNLLRPYLRRSSTFLPQRYTAVGEL